MTNTVVSTTQIFIESSSQNCGLCISREPENHVNGGPVSIWDINEPTPVPKQKGRFELMELCKQLQLL